MQNHLVEVKINVACKFEVLGLEDIEWALRDVPSIFQKLLLKIHCIILFLQRPLGSSCLLCSLICQSRQLSI